MNARQQRRAEREKRLNRANGLLYCIARVGSGHLKVNDQIAHFEIRNGRLWYIDEHGTAMWCTSGKPSFDKRFGWLGADSVHRALSWIIFRLAIYVWDNQPFKPKWIGLSDDLTKRKDILNYGPAMDFVQNGFIVSGIMNDWNKTS